MTADGSGESSHRIARLVDELVGSGFVSAVVAIVGDRDRVLTAVSAGRRSRTRERCPSAASLFDLASLSKPFTATLALTLARSGDLPLSLELGEAWDGVDARLARVTLEELLRHQSGLVPWTPLYARLSSPQEVAPLLLSGDLLGARRGTYSDLGYLLWAKTAEKVLRRSLESLLRSNLLQPLGLVRDVTASIGKSRRLVECRLDTSRERDLARKQGFRVVPTFPALGEIQDGNARWLGTYCGHAGLFGSARALWRLGAEWLQPHVLSTNAIPSALAGTGRYRLGWRRATSTGPAGPNLSSSALGHTGFTGGSLWLDPTLDRIFVLLAHRTDCTVDMDPARQRMHASIDKGR